MTNNEKIRVIRDNIKRIETSTFSRNTISKLGCSIYINDKDTIASAEKVLHFFGNSVNNYKNIPLKMGVNFEKTYRIINDCGSIDLIATMMNDGSNAYLWNKKGACLTVYTL